MAYFEELADLRYLLDEIDSSFRRFELAAKSLESSARRSSDGDAASMRDLGELLQTLASVIGRAQNAQRELVEIARFLDSLASDELPLPIGEAKAVVEEVSSNMDELISAWRRVAQRMRVALLRVEADRGPEGPPRWEEHWRGDAELAREVAREKFHQHERDMLMMDLYYDLGRSQASVAKTLGVSQPTVAGRLATLESSISTEIAARCLADRFDIPGVQASGSGRDGFFGASLRTASGEANVLVFSSDRLTRKPVPRLDFSRVGSIDYVGVYLVTTGRFWFRLGHEVGELLTELPYDDEEEIVRAFGIEEEAMK